jgi:response regulator RpfG family c-di-GMP phosphodiesterase
MQVSENRINILIVDDYPDIVSILKLGLMRQGFNVVAFTDPNLALGHFRLNHKNYDLVISDIRMPTMNGFEFIKKVKRLKPTVKVFFMTAFEIDTDEWSNVLPSVKIDEFIQKPFTLEKIGKLVSTHIPFLKRAS